ncbi:hypothetical protein CTA1_5084 [Colletotrichum tanaceti]|uniref:Uncharacterized protein n=1 Tax=Colletotrichum tanaceti TaxID=1306861 RepID=A0A4U6X4K5_9PEZI|nr:hypothetical protein CTA1_5084 [Colletotrichum tanaceti]
MKIVGIARVLNHASYRIDAVFSFVDTDLGEVTRLGRRYCRRWPSRPSSQTRSTAPHVEGPKVSAVVKVALVAAIERANIVFQTKTHLRAGAAINAAEQALLPLLFMTDVHYLGDEMVVSVLSNVPDMTAIADELFHLATEISFVDHKANHEIQPRCQPTLAQGVPLRALFRFICVQYAAQTKAVLSTFNATHVQSNIENPDSGSESNATP